MSFSIKPSICYRRLYAPSPLCISNPTCVLSYLLMIGRAHRLKRALLICTMFFLHAGTPWVNAPNHELQRTTSAVTDPASGLHLFPLRGRAAPSFAVTELGVIESGWLIFSAPHPLDLKGPTYSAARTSWMTNCSIVRPRNVFRSIVNATSHGGSGSGFSPPPKKTASCSA